MYTQDEHGIKIPKAALFAGLTLAFGAVSCLLTYLSTLSLSPFGDQYAQKENDTSDRENSAGAVIETSAATSAINAALE